MMAATPAPPPPTATSKPTSIIVTATATATATVTTTTTTAIMPTGNGTLIYVNGSRYMGSFKVPTYVITSIETYVNTNFHHTPAWAHSSPVRRRVLVCMSSYPNNHIIILILVLLISMMMTIIAPISVVLSVSMCCLAHLAIYGIHGKYCCCRCWWWCLCRIGLPHRVFEVVLVMM